MRWRHLPLYGGRLHRGGMRWEIFCDDGGIDLGDGAVRQAGPWVVPARQRKGGKAAPGGGAPRPGRGQMEGVKIASVGDEHIEALLILHPALSVAAARATHCTAWH